MKEKKICVTSIFNFDAAHYLQNYEGKCKNLHGHTYKLEISVKGSLGANGLIIDFNELENLVEKEILIHLDHHCLNEVLDFNPTCELLSLWIWERLDAQITALDCSLEMVKLWETPTNCISLKREDLRC